MGLCLLAVAIWSVDEYGGYSLNVIRGMHGNSKIILTLVC